VFASYIQTAASVLTLRPGSKNPTEGEPHYPPAIPLASLAASALSPHVARARV